MFIVFVKIFQSLKLAKLQWDRIEDIKISSSNTLNNKLCEFFPAHIKLECNF